MNKKSNTLKKEYRYTEGIENEKKSKKLYEEVIKNGMKAKSGYHREKIDKGILINNQNNFKSINIINNNYNNIIINNKLTPNKKLLIEDKTFSINKKNYKFLTLSQNNKNNLKKNYAYNLVLDNQHQGNDIEYKYKLILKEKNNLINQLKSEIEHYKYKNLNKSQSPDMIPTITIKKNKRIFSGLKNKKNAEFGNIKNKIQNIFSITKRDIKYDKHNNNFLNSHNINNIKNINKMNINSYNTIKTYMGKSDKNNPNFANSERINNFMSKIQSKPLNLKSIDNNSNVTNNYKNNNNLIFNYSLKNDLKLNGNNNKIALNINNKYNSLETDRNYKFEIKNPKLIYSLNSINKNIINNNELDNYNSNYNAITFEDNIERKYSLKNLKRNNLFFNKISTSPFSLKNETVNNYIMDKNYYLDSFLDKNDSNDISSNNFDYKENYENLKNRMSNLIESLFKIIEIQQNNK